MSKVPRWLKPYFKENDSEHLRQFVQGIEASTQAELVPLIVRSSIDLPLFRGLLMTMSFVITLVISPWVHAHISWNFPFSFEAVEIIIGMVLMLLAFFAGGSSTMVKFVFNKSYLQNSVFRRACAEFFENQLHHTESRTAVLFMYSVIERKAMIIADPNLRKIPQSLWQLAIEKMIAAAKQKKFVSGFEAALQVTAVELTKHFPPLPHNTNEMADMVIIKE
jgi:putative membrane protein